MRRIRQLRAPGDVTGAHPGNRYSARAEFRTDVKDALLQLLAEQSESSITHLAHVAELATGTAVNLGLSPAQVELTRMGAELHDVGKVGIPASIIDKPGPLNAEEQWFMQRHSEIGERIIATTPALEAIAPIVRAVHERPDGRGYPDGLRLEEIPVSSRIIAVVDAFDAMTNDRPYQSAIGREQALVELRRHAGTQFDAAVVEAFIRAIADQDPAARPPEPRATTGLRV
jgi:HD-GYP domain-containing protein (c-di-GMP phosphodiesterase class II)